MNLGSDTWLNMMYTCGLHAMLGHAELKIFSQSKHMLGALSDYAMRYKEV
jgi:hypothetical protein